MAFCSQCGTALPDNARFCPKCGEAVTADAAPVPKPIPTPAAVVHATPGPAPLRAAPPPRSGRGGLILPVLLVLALAVIGFAWWSQRDGARPIAGDNAAQTAETPEAAEKTSDAPASVEKAEEKIEGSAGTSAASLDSAFNADPQGARARYSGPVTVSGIVATMVTPGPTPSLSLEGRTRLNFVLVNFPSGTREQLAGVAKGDRVTVACRGVNAVAGTTVLQGCALE